MGAIEVFNNVLAQVEHDVLAIDPGGTSGMAWVRSDERVVRWEAVPMPETIAWVEQWCGNRAVGWVVVERFILYPWMAKQLGFNQLETSKLIGQIEMLLEGMGIEVRYQGAAVLKTVPWQKQGCGPHCKDAVKHLTRSLLDAHSNSEGIISL